MCLDDPYSWQIQGNSQSTKAHVLYIKAEPCKERSDCETDPLKLVEFIQNHSFFFFVNTAEYLPSEYGAKAVKKKIVGPDTIPLGSRSHSFSL